MKITPDAIEEIQKADKALAESESPALRQVRAQVAQNLEERRQAEYAAAQAAQQPAQSKDASRRARINAEVDQIIARKRAAAAEQTDIPTALNQQPEYVIARSPESQARLKRETDHKLAQLDRRLIRARREGLDRVAEVKQEVADLKQAVASDDAFNALDIFERQRAIRKQLRTARAAKDEAKIAELVKEAGWLQRQQSRCGSLRYVSIPAESED